MLTDRSPFEYRYLSRRLLGEIARSDRAGRRSRGKIGLHAGPLSAEVSTAPPDYDNLYELAEVATRAVSDHTGSVDTEAPYLRAEINGAMGFVPIHAGWESDHRVNVACVYADYEVDRIGPIFAGLFGSTSNVVGWREAPDIGPGWWPSDGLGIYEIFDANREKGDPRLEKGRLEEEMELTPIELLAEARTTATGIRALRIEPLDLLAKVHVRATDVRLDGTQYAVALVGAPIWVRTPAPTPLG